MINVSSNNPTIKSRSKSDGFSAIMREAADFFKEQNVSMVQGFAEILGESSLFNEYVRRMTSGLDANDAAQLEQLCENARTNILQESTIAGIAPIAGLSIPTLRKMWMRSAMKDAMPTETAKMPAFAISWMNPFIQGSDGVKQYLPAALRSSGSAVDKPAVVATALAVGAVNLLTSTVIGGVAASVANRDSVDPTLMINKVRLTVTAGTVGAYSTTTKDVPCAIKADINGNFYGVVSVVNGVTATGDAKYGLIESGTILGHMNFMTGEGSFASPGSLITHVFFKGYLSQENNTRTQSVGFEIAKRDVKIGPGAHLNAPVPVEFLTDTLALYNIDGTVEVVDLMSLVSAQKLDLELIAFVSDLQTSDCSAYQGYFSVKPAAGFAGSPTMWRSEIRTTLDWWANKMKSDIYFSQGHFVVFGNPVDIQLIPDIQWDFRAVQAERGGVKVAYDFGAFTSANAFRVVSTENAVAGNIYVFFVPDSDQYMTLKYYPYYYGVNSGYRDPNQSNVPNIMVTKRHAIESLIPVICKITISNNDGSLMTSYAI